MEYEYIRTEQVGRVRRLILNRPQARNAQSRRLTEELDDAFQAAEDDPGTGVVVLMGAGDHFSAGHDLGTPQELADREVRPTQAGVRGRYGRSYDLNVEVNLRWRNLRKPTIAAVQGYCIFAGWAIASACDIIFAADDAMFLPANFQYFSVPWDLGSRKAKEVLFESRFLSAQEVLDLGFVNRVLRGLDHRLQPRRAGDWRFPSGSSGAFGADLPGPWSGIGTLLDLWTQLRDIDQELAAGWRSEWFDVHASLPAREATG